jgi:flagellar FliL protein
MSTPSAPATAPAAAAAAEVSETLPPRRKPVMLYALIGVVVVGFGAGGFFLAPRLLGGGAGHSEAKTEAKTEEKELPTKATVPMGSVVVNLAETKNYVKVGLELGVADVKEVKEVGEAKARVLDLLITMLSTTPADTLASGEGRLELKEELLAKIREELGLHKVSRVYFTEFVIQ